MRISANCMTRGPAGRVAAILSLLRPVVDELLVAVDERAGADVVDAVATVADRVVLYPYAEPVDRPLPWLHAQCAGDWVLTIDDDEVPSSALLDALPDLVGDERVTHVWIPRRWLYPDARRFLDAPPWRPDYLLRLVRNDRRLLRFPTETHHPIAVLGPGRYSDAPLYHLDLVESSREERERKAERYERLWPGKRAAGLPLNLAYYVPERVPDAPTAPLPAPDLELVERVRTAAAPATSPRTEVERATREEIDRFWEGRALSPSAYVARLELAEEPRPFREREARTLDVRVTNGGDAVWPYGDAHPQIRVVGRWPDDPGARELRTPLPHELAPGETALVPAAVAAPSGGGRRRLHLDLVHEHVRWFGCGLDVDVDVRPQRRILVASDSTDALERLARDEPDVEPILLARDPDALRPRTAARVVPTADAFLLDGLPRTPLVAAPVFAARAARLLWQAVALRRGRSPRLDRGGSELLDALASVDEVVCPDGAASRRERATVAVTALAARALRTEVRR